MFWAILLPVGITFLALILLIFFLVWKSRGKERILEVQIAKYIFISLIVFIPSCMGIQKIIDPFRFGEFKYKSYDDIGSRMVRRYLPAAATDLNVIQSQGGNVAVYTISRSELQAWITEFSEGKDELNFYVPSKATEEVLDHDRDYQFKRFGWDLPIDAIKYNAPLAFNGAGFEVWHSASKNMAFQYSGYW